jgi:glucose-6-phosphate isomerase
MRGSYDTVCVIGIGGSALGPWISTLFNQRRRGTEQEVHTCGLMWRKGFEQYRDQFAAYEKKRDVVK